MGKSEGKRGRRVKGSKLRPAKAKANKRAIKRKTRSDKPAPLRRRRRRKPWVTRREEDGWPEAVLDQVMIIGSQKIGTSSFSLWT
jgi:hypothetical protein